MGPNHVVPPDLITNVINNKPVLRFDEAKQQGITIDGGALCINNFTVFAVAKADAEHEIDPLLDQYGGTAGQNYLFGADHKGNDAGAGISFGTNGISIYEHGSDYMPPTAMYTTSLSGFKVITMKYVTLESSKPRSTIYLNKHEIPGEPSARNTVYSPTFIGGGHYGSFTGDVVEILVYDAALSDANIKSISDVLMTKYGL